MSLEAQMSPLKSWELQQALLLHLHGMPYASKPTSGKAVGAKKSVKISFGDSSWTFSVPFSLASLIDCHKTQQYQQIRNINLCITGRSYSYLN